MTDDSGAIVFAIIVLATIFGAIGAAIAVSKGKSGAGFALGFFLGPIGILIAAFLSPTAAVQAHRDRQLAAAIVEATAGSPHASGGMPLRSGLSAADLRQAAITEAIRRDPSLANANSPDELRQLAEQTATVESELKLKYELADVKAQQAARAEQARQEVVREELARQQEEREALRVKQQQEKAVARAQAAVAARADREAKAAAMRPLRRWAYLNPAAASAVAVLASLLLVAAIAVPVRMTSDRARDRESRGAAASASAVASASVSAAAAASASASASASAAASARASASAVAAAEAAAERATCLRDVKGKELDLAGCDLSGEELAGLNLSGRDLRGADLSNATLSRVIFDGAKLDGVTWSGATCPDGTPAADGGSCTKHLLRPGGRLRPLRLGQAGRLGDWKVIVSTFQANSASNAIAQSQYNDPPGTGYVYALLQVKVTYTGAGVGLSEDVDFDINGESSTSSDAYCHVSPWYGGELPRTGQSSSGRDCIYIRTSKTKRGTIRATDDSAFEDAVYWAVP